MAVAPDVVREAVRLRLIPPEDAARFLLDAVPAPPIADPFADLTAVERVNLSIRAACSGAPAWGDLASVLVHEPTGRVVPHPSQRKDNR